MARLRIVAGVDETDCSMTALRKALSLAAGLDADLHVVFASHVPGAMVAAMGGLPTVSADIGEAQREAVWSRLGSLLESTRARRVDIEGYPPDALVAYADEVDADLIIVGSRGRGDFASLLLGSVSHRVVNQAGCDVMVVRKEI